MALIQDICSVCQQLGWRYIRVPKINDLIQHKKGNRKEEPQFMRSGNFRFEAGMQMTRRRPSEQYHDFMRISLIPRIFQHSIDFQYCRAVQKIWERPEGGAQGCSTSEVTADAFARRMEYMKSDVCVGRLRFRDDIIRFLKNEDDPEIDREYYGNKCPLDVEPRATSLEFIGTTTFIIDGQVAVVPQSPKGTISSIKSATVKTKALVHNEICRAYMYSNELGRKTELFKERVKEIVARLEQSGHKVGRIYREVNEALFNLAMKR